MNNASNNHEAKIPTTRAECAGLPRPCPFVTCKYNLRCPTFHTRTRGRKAWVAVQSPRSQEGCIADMLDKRPTPWSLEEIGDAFGLTRERVRQIEARALRRVLQAILASGFNLDAMVPVDRAERVA